MTWAPPKKRDVQIKLTPKGRYSVKVPHGHELADALWFALLLWDAGETYRKSPPCIHCGSKGNVLGNGFCGLCWG